MTLLTAEIRNKLPKLYATENVDLPDKQVIAKFFDPGSAWTWLVVEGTFDHEDAPGDWLFFGLVVGQESEWGYFRLSELAGYRGRFGLGIERDLHFTPCL